MHTKKTAITLIILTIVLFAFSVAEGDDNLFCVSLKEFHKTNKLFRRIRSFDFHVTNAEIQIIPDTPSVHGFNVENNINWSGSYDGNCNGGRGGPGGFEIDSLYDDFVVIRKRPGVKLDKVRIKFSFTVEQDSINNKGEETDDGEVTYHFTNKDLNIRKCKDLPY
ncbi:MAG: hypothetical protein HQK99_06080 [Nitrospirae bacterium]|nr:hypothetical protein [Nitrospirota bacterium]